MTQPGPTPVQGAAPRKLPKHLMDPNNPQPQVRRDGMSMSQVQKWVMSTLAVTTVLHLAGGLVLAAYFIEEERLDARIGLLVIAGIFGALGVVVGFAIHGKRVVSAWVLLGTVPALVGAWLMFVG